VLLERYRRPAVPSEKVFDDDCAEDMAVAAKVVGGDDDAETAVATDELVVAGERV
jgi:hypothetical protein